LTNGTRHESLGLFCEWYEGKLVDKVILGGAGDGMDRAPNPHDGSATRTSLRVEMPVVLRANCIYV